MALARADQDRFARIATGTGQFAERLFTRLAPITDEQLATWQRTVVPAVRSAQRAAATQRIGYLSAYSRLAGEPAQPLEVDVTGLLDGLRNGVPITDVYARPVITARAALSEGRTIGEAIRAGAVRAHATAETDVMLAARQAEHEALPQLPHVVGYRRVPNGGACRLCLAAATQRYHVRDLRPCHVNCRCGVVPIIGHRDPGAIIDHEALAALKRDGVISDLGALKRSGGRYGAEVRHHGELGPVLVDPQHSFTGPRAVPG